MNGILKNKLFVKVFTTIIAVTFAAPAFAFESHPSRIIPDGTVYVYEGDTKVGEFTAESPLPEGSMLTCNGKCGVKMDDTYMVATDKSAFSISHKDGKKELRVNKGTIYFALSALPQPMKFRTAAGVIDVEQLILNAASDGGLLKGYISATPERTELGVFEGGSMLVLTPKEETLIKSGKRIILAQQIEEEEDDDDSGLFWIPLGMAAGMVLLGASLDDDKKAASPAE
jgi:hypothetical protein